MSDHDSGPVWCEKCPLQPISSGAMSYPPGQASLLGRPVRFIEKNDYLFCGSWLPSPQVSPRLLTLRSFKGQFPVIHLSLTNQGLLSNSTILSIDIPQTDRQESRVGLNLVSQVGNKKLNKVLTNSLFYLRLEWLLHPAQRQFLPLDPCDEKLLLKSYIFGFAFNESYWNSK